MPAVTTRSLEDSENGAVSRCANFSDVHTCQRRLDIRVGDPLPGARDGLTGAHHCTCASLLGNGHHQRFLFNPS